MSEVWISGALEIQTVRSGAAGAAIVQLYVAELLPYAFDTLTRNVCPPAARPL